MTATAAAPPAQSQYRVPTPYGILNVGYFRDAPTGPVRIGISSGLLVVNTVEVAVELTVELPSPDLDLNSRPPYVNVRRARGASYLYSDVPHKTQKKAQDVVVEALRDVAAGRVTPDIEAAADAGFRDVSAKRLEYVTERSHERGRDEVQHALSKWAIATAEVDMHRRAVAGLPLDEVQRSPADMHDALAAALSEMLNAALTPDAIEMAERRR